MRRPFLDVLDDRERERKRVIGEAQNSANKRECVTEGVNDPKPRPGRQEWHRDIIFFEEGGGGHQSSYCSATRSPSRLAGLSIDGGEGAEKERRDKATSQPWRTRYFFFSDSLKQRNTRYAG